MISKTFNEYKTITFFRVSTTTILIYFFFYFWYKDEPFQHFYKDDFNIDNAGIYAFYSMLYIAPLYILNRIKFVLRQIIILKDKRIYFFDNAYYSIIIMIEFVLLIVLSIALAILLMTCSYKTRFPLFMTIYMIFAILSVLSVFHAATKLRKEALLLERIKNIIVSKEYSCYYIEFILSDNSTKILDVENERYEEIMNNFNLLKYISGDKGNGS